MKPTTYTPTQKSKTFNLIIGLFFTFIGGIFSCVSCLLPLLYIAMIRASPSGDPSLIFGPLIALACGTMFGLLFVGVGVWAAFFAEKNIKLELTADSLNYYEGNKVTSLKLAEISKLSVHEAWQKRVHYWYIRIEDRNGTWIDLEITQDNYFGTFDVQTVLRDLLPRLTSQTQMEMRIKNYIETGRIEN